MLHPLEAKLGRFQRCLRRWLVAYGVSRLVAVAVGAVLVLGAVDYVFRFQDRGLRVMLTGALLAVFGWACYRWVYRPATVRLGRLELARRLGRRFPELGDDLAGAIEFLHQDEDDPVAGSAGLRRVVIAETEAKAERVDFASIIDRRPVSRGVILAVGVCLVAGIVFLLDTLSCQIALARLAYPLGEVDWPRKHHLQVVERVERVARGQPFEIEVVDRDGDLPRRVDIQYRHEEDNGTIVEQTQPMQRVGSAMIARRENVTRPFSYRVEGGDDRTMRWIDVEVVEPPAVASLVATVTPPEYTGAGPIRSSGPLRVLRGSRVSISGVANKPLRSATMRLDSGEAISCTIGKDGRRFVVESFEPQASGGYGFELVDREGIRGSGTDREEIRLVEDQPPSVGIERPPGTVFVTPEATLPVRATVGDDLALRRVDLVMEPDEAGKPVEEGDAVTGVISLYEGPPKATAPADGTRGERRTIDYRWNLAEMALRPGDQFSFRVTAEDYRPQSGKSDARRVVVVRPEELIDRLADRQQAILTELGRALNLEQESRLQVGEIRDKWAGAATVEQSGIDRLRGAELVQREVDRILAGETGSVPADIRSLLVDLADNRIENPDVERRMDALLIELDRLGRKVLPVIAREVTASIKTAEARLAAKSAGGKDAAARDGRLGKALDAACAGQDEVIATLERLLGQLNRWNDYRRFHRRWAGLIRRQESLADRTKALDRDMLGKMPEDILPDAAARLGGVANEQSELARHLDQLLQEMDEALAPLAERDPLAAETIADAVALSRELGISGTMRAAAGAAGRNRLGQTKTLQAKCLADMREVFDLLSNRREDELARLAERLPAAEGVLGELIRRQKALGERMEQESARTVGEEQRRWEWESLGRQQEAIREAAAQFAEQLVRLLAEEPAESVREAAGHMAQAARAAATVQTQQAVQHARDAEKSLVEAAARLNRHLQKTRTEAEAKQLARLESNIKLLHERQRKLADETSRLGGLLAPDAARTGSQAVGLRRLAGDQQRLRRETDELAAQMAEAVVFSRVLDKAAEQMAVAAGWLGRQQAGEPTQAAQQRALGHLARLVEALATNSQGGAQQQAPAGEEGGEGGKQNDRGPNPGAMAQLRLLRQLEQELMVRTQAWEKRYGGVSPLPAEAVREYKELSDRQGELAGMLFEWIEGQKQQEDGPDVDEGEQP